MPTYITPTDVSNGMLLTETMTADLFGINTGTLYYLRDGLVTYGYNCPPIYFMGARTLNQTIANSTQTNIVLDNFSYPYGINSQYWNGTSISTTGCGSQSLTNRMFLCHFSTQWNASTVGFREQKITISTTRCTAEFTSNTASMRATAAGAPGGGVTVIQNVLIPIRDTDLEAEFQITLSCWQNSGAALGVFPWFKLIQLPLV